MFLLSEKSRGYTTKITKDHQISDRNCIIKSCKDHQDHQRSPRSPKTCSAVIGHTSIMNEIACCLNSTILYYSIFMSLGSPCRQISPVFAMAFPFLPFFLVSDGILMENSWIAPPWAAPVASETPRPAQRPRASSPRPRPPWRRRPKRGAGPAGPEAEAGRENLGCSGGPNVHVRPGNERIGCHWLPFFLAWD